MEQKQSEKNIEIKHAISSEDYLTARILILEYVDWLGIDLAFQNFDSEIATMPVTYGLPNGGLFVVYRDEKAVGVAGIKKFNETECEVKRMYVQPESRGLGIGKLLLRECILLARNLGYKKIKLDTADRMKSAINLYLENGFIEIEAYRHNPYEDARYFELDLTL